MKVDQIIIAPSEMGAGEKGAGLGPEALRINCNLENFPLFERIPSVHTFAPTPTLQHALQPSLSFLEDFIPVYDDLCKHTHQHLSDGKKCLILSGDHSNAGGSLAGFKEAFPNAKTGIIWIDAHADIHTPYTTPSGNVHGMPIGASLGLENKSQKVRMPDAKTLKAWDDLCTTGPSKICPKFKPQDLFFIDIRDLEKQEWNTIKELGIAHYDHEDRQQQGIFPIIEACKKHFEDYDALYISFDVDSLDAALVPGTGTPVPDGLNIGQAIDLLKAFTELPQFKALEITEINPLLDRQNTVAKAVTKILKSIMDIDG